MARLLYIFVLKLFVIHEKIAFGNAEPLIRDETVVAGPDEFPFVVSVGWKKTKNMSEEETHFFGGALITQRHLLTAAHCKFFVINIREVRVKIGSNDLLKGKKYKIDEWDTFDDWTFRNVNGSKRYVGNDISVITLSKTTNVKPAYISDMKNEKWLGATAVTAEWGLNKNDELTRFLEKADLNVLEHDVCNEMIKKANLANEVFRVPSRYLCTNAKPYVALGFADSGSPLLVNKRTVIGVNRSSCPKLVNDVSERLNLHVGVYYYMDFIKNVTESTKSKFFFLCNIHHVSTPPLTQD